MGASYIRTKVLKNKVSPSQPNYSLIKVPVVVELPILEPAVSKIKFEQAVNDLKSVQETYKKIWKLRYVKYPRILIDVLSKTEKPTLTLLLNLENWDFLPPSATLISVDLRRYLVPELVPEAFDDPQHPVKHIVFNPSISQIWFCSPGFYEYHQFFPEDRWELIKKTDEGTIIWIVNRVCILIDRQKLE